MIWYIVIYRISVIQNLSWGLPAVWSKYSWQGFWPKGWSTNMVPSRFTNKFTLSWFTHKRFQTNIFGLFTNLPHNYVTLTSTDDKNSNTSRMDLPYQRWMSACCIALKRANLCPLKKILQFFFLLNFSCLSFLNVNIQNLRVK